MRYDLLRNVTVFLFSLTMHIFLIPNDSYAERLTYQQFYEQFTNLQPDEAKVSVIKDCFFQRDAGAFSFVEGKMYFFKPLNGKLCMAAYVGKGSFTFMPPTKVEQDHLERLFDVRMYDKEFKRAFFIFTDTTFNEITNNYPALNGSFVKSTFKAQEEAYKYIVDPLKKNIRSNIAEAILEKNCNGFFLAHIEPTSGDEVAFMIDPNMDEEVSFFRGVIISGGLNDYYETINRFHPQEDYSKSIRYLENKCHDEIVMNKTILDINIEHQLNFSASAEVHFTGKRSGDEWIVFKLGHILEVDSIVSSSGVHLNYHKSKGEYRSSTLYVRFEETLREGIRDSIKFYYKGDIINRTYNYIYIDNKTKWYPDYGYREKQDFRLTFAYPNNYYLFVSGKLIEQKNIELEYIKSTWSTSTKPTNMTFRMVPTGLYQILENKDTLNPKIIFYALNTHNCENTFNDINSSYELFSNLLGFLDYDTLSVFEAYNVLYESYPNFIDLSYRLMKSNERRGYQELHIAFKTAMQWWCTQITPKTYHDFWVTKILSVYCGLMFLQQKFNDKFFDILFDYKKWFLDEYSGIGSSNSLGAISLGYRNKTYNSKSDFNILMYQKGAWVLHMLRNLMIDLNTMDESVFMAMIKDFFKTYQGKSATTNDFKEMVEKYAGGDMTWFFDQWVHGIELPTYNYSFRTTETPEGKYKVRCKIRQEGVPPDFKMFVPIKIDFGDDKFTRLRVFITGDVAEFDLPLLPLEPEEIIFNDLNSVLCEFDEVDWDD